MIIAKAEQAEYVTYLYRILSYSMDICEEKRENHMESFLTCGEVSSSDDDLSAVGLRCMSGVGGRGFVWVEMMTCQQ